jgi:arylsulfatase A
MTTRHRQSGVVPRIVVLLALLALFCTRGGKASLSADSDRPNIVVIVFDDMGYGEPPCYRPESPFRLPNVDRLASEGMRFTDAHSASAVCTPTRYGLLTGRYPMRIGDYGVLQTYSAPVIEKGRLTVAELMRRNGYRTAAIGKWHLGMRWPGVKPHDGHRKENPPPLGTFAMAGPTTRGFEYFCGYTHAENIGMILEQDRVIANFEPSAVQPYLAQKAVSYVDESARKGRPFFLYVALAVPHEPVVPAAEFQGKGNGTAYGDWLYEGDWVTGQVLDALERNKLAENTIVIVTSDNGAARRVYAPLRGCKTSIYEGGHRIPFIVRWPGRIGAGSVCEDTVCLNDLMATCADLVGVKLPPNAGEDSVSILPDLLGTANGPLREATVHEAPSGDLAIRRGPWKLIFLKNGVEELYNLQRDPGETQDIAAQNRPLVDEMRQLMERYIASGRSTPGPNQSNRAAIQLGRPAKGTDVEIAIDPLFD